MPSSAPRTARRGLWVAAALALAGAASWGLLAQVRGQVTQPSACRVSPNKVAAPPVIRLGETVRVTLTLTAECPPEPAPVDVVLVVDQSNSMLDDDKLVNAKQAALAFLEAMDLTDSRVALVAFNQVAGVRQPLTQDPRRIEEALDGIIAGGQTNVSAAIDVAHAELIREPVGHNLAMVVLTDGINTAPGAEDVVLPADRAKADGITIATFCAGGQCDPRLPLAASDPSLHFDVADPTQLAALYRDLAGRLQANAVAALVVRDQIPANMRYIAGSAVPAPDVVGADFLEWRLAGVIPPEGLTYDLEPLEVGVHPTNVVATGEFTDRLGHTGQTEFPVPEVTVLCGPEPLEVHFLIDNSNCPYGQTLNGESVIVAIQRGVADVLDQMNLGRDRAAVIGFGDRAITYQELTDDRQAILDAVMQIGFRDDQARLDLAYGEVAKAMDSPLHRPDGLPATIAVTDGPMMITLERVVVRAEDLRARGVKHYTIGIGSALQDGLLRQIAEPGGYRELPFGGDVITAYHELGAMAADRAMAHCAPTPTPDATAEATPEPPAEGGALLPWSQK